jgi:stage II sporulation protein D
VVSLGGVLFFTPWGCAPPPEVNTPLPAADRIMRVNILPDVSQAALSGEGCSFRTSLEPTWRPLALPRGVVLSYRDGWYAGNTLLGRGELVLRADTVGGVTIADAPGATEARQFTCRGQYRLVASAGNRFDVVNDVDLDEYLKGVLARELLPNWRPVTYHAQAIVARTYALYVRRTAPSARHFDVWATERSQVYGGLAAETALSREAAAATAGLVAAWGPAGSEKIFKTYFSSCCGGITQSARDAFGDPDIEPLREQSSGTLCSASPRFTWGPVVVARSELSQRIKTWGQRRNRPEANLGTIRAVQIAQRNRLGRPIAYTIDDSRDLRYTLRAEDLRTAVNTDAPEGARLYSGFVENVVSDPQYIRFVGGRGFGHGVGMCQWCAEARARAGMRYEDIVLAAYPGAVLVRAY